MRRTVPFGRPGPSVPPQWLDDPRVRWARGAAASFWTSLVAVSKVVHALILREAITRYGRRSAGYIWALFVPVLQAAVLIALFSAIGRGAAAGDSLVVFFITGIIPVFAWRNAAVRGATALQANRWLMTYPQVRPFEIVLARTILEMSTSAVVVLVIVVAMAVFGGLTLDHWIDRPLSLACAIGVFVLLCHGTAVLSAQIGRIFDLWKDIMAATGRVFFFASGVWYTFASLPPGPRQIVAYNPLAHLIEWIRDAVISSYSSDLYNPWYPLAVAIVLLTIGLLMEWRSTFVDTTDS